MLIWLLSAGNFVIGMGAFMVIGLMPLLAEDLDVGQGQAGAVLTVYALAYAVGSPLLVAVTGRVPRRTLLAGAMALFGLAALGAALAPSLPLLLAARVAGAFGAGLFSPLAAATAAGLSAPEGRGRALARVFFGLTLAQVRGCRPARGWPTACPGTWPSRWWRRWRSRWSSGCCGSCRATWPSSRPRCAGWARRWPTCAAW